MLPSHTTSAAAIVVVVVVVVVVGGVPAPLSARKQHVFLS